MSKPHKPAEVIKAWAEGKRVRVVGPSGRKDIWFDNSTNSRPSWTADRYEIAPEPLRGWVNLNKEGRDAELYETTAEADKYAGPDRIRCVEMVEVTHND